MLVTGGEIAHQIFSARIDEPSRREPTFERSEIGTICSAGVRGSAALHPRGVEKPVDCVTCRHKLTMRAQRVTKGW